MCKAPDGPGGADQEIDFIERTTRRFAAALLNQGGQFVPCPSLFVQSPARVGVAHKVSKAQTALLG